jgi:hypothetical protein
LGTIPAGSSVSIVIEAEFDTSSTDTFSVSAQAESEIFDTILENNSAELSFSVSQRCPRGLPKSLRGIWDFLRFYLILYTILW